MRVISAWNCGLDAMPVFAHPKLLGSRFHFPLALLLPVRL
jgi:hypothetical protein